MSVALPFPPLAFTTLGGGGGGGRMIRNAGVYNGSHIHHSVVVRFIFI